MNQNTVVFSSGKKAGRFSGITVRANFIVSGAPSQPGGLPSVGACVGCAQPARCLLSVELASRHGRSLQPVGAAPSSTHVRQAPRRLPPPAGGQMNGMERRPSSCLVVRGRPPLLSQTQMVVQAIDPAQFIKPTLFVPVRSTAAGPVTNLAFRCREGSGGVHRQQGSVIRSCWRGACPSSPHLLCSSRTALAAPLGGQQTNI